MPVNPVSQPIGIAVSLKITLPGYVTPSLNETRRKHWSAVTKEKKKARGALLSGLNDLVATPR
jgi:hypothetical protein